MSMNVPVMNKTTVILTPCVPTPKDLMFVDVFAVMRVMAGTAQVWYLPCRNVFRIMDMFRSVKIVKGKEVIALHKEV